MRVLLLCVAGAIGGGLAAARHANPWPILAIAVFLCAVLYLPPMIRGRPARFLGGLPGWQGVVTDAISILAGGFAWYWLQVAGAGTAA
jgi:hypothetical protein